MAPYSVIAKWPNELPINHTSKTT